MPRFHCSESLQAGQGVARSRGAFAINAPPMTTPKNAACEAHEVAHEQKDTRQMNEATAMNTPATKTQLEQRAHALPKRDIAAAAEPELGECRIGRESDGNSESEGGGTW